ncbi:putative orphan protein [Pseudoalteromonas luteoviolacea B = ATCC 29581]|nr:putative orphan protein [Pseudoalteromonas luteoviolacea B = ATCC 29581]
MANQQQKKQALLGGTQAKKQVKRPANKQVAAQLQRQQQILKQQAAAQQTAANSPKKNVVNKLITLVVVLIIAIIFPKPQLISYEKLGMVATSVYWPGLPGLDPVLFDSALHPRPALDKGTLYLCIEKTNPDSCQKYNIVDRKGFFSAIGHLFSN